MKKIQFDIIYISRSSVKIKSHKSGLTSGGVQARAKEGDMNNSSMLRIRIYFLMRALNFNSI